MINLNTASALNIERLRNQIQQEGPLTTTATTSNHLSSDQENNDKEKEKENDNKDNKNNDKKNNKNNDNKNKNNKNNDNKNNDHKKKKNNKNNHKKKKKRNDKTGIELQLANPKLPPPVASRVFTADHTSQDESNLKPPPVVDHTSKSLTVASKPSKDRTSSTLDDSHDHRRVRSNFRQHVDKWFDLPENSFWKVTSFQTPGGIKARNRLKVFVWARLTDEERESFGGDARAETPPKNERFNIKITEISLSSRNKVAKPTCLSAPKGALNCSSGSRKTATTRKSQVKNQVKIKAAKKRYMKTTAGKTSAQRRSKKFHLKRREAHFAKRASQHYPEFSSGQPVSEIALELISKPRLKLFGMSTRQYQEHVGPGQYFLSARASDCERTKEAFAQWTVTSRPYPPIMKNPAGYPVQERLVDPDEVEILGLKRFTFTGMKAMGWKWLPLMEMDLDGSSTLRPLYALEQQCQILTHDLRLGSQRNNRVPGAGGWDQKVKKESRFGVVGFAYAPPGWLNKYYDRIAFVNGKKEFTQPEIARMSLRGANVTMSGVGARY